MRQESTKERVYNYIYSEILSGRLKADDKIPQEKISQQLNLSRTPVREALIELMKEGLFERKPNRGFWLRRIDLDELKDVYSIIGCLEGHAAASASYKLSREDFDLLKKIVKKIEESIDKKDYPGYYSLQLEFHNIIVRASGNKKLYDLVSSLKERYITQVHLVFGIHDELYEVLKQSNDEHRHIVMLLEKGEKKKLESYLKDVHWKISRADAFYDKQMVRRHN